MKTQKRIQILLVLFFVFSCLMLGRSASALTNVKMYVQVPSDALSPQSEFNATLYVDADAKINALDVEVSYPKDVLEFIDSNNARSIVELWKVKPKILPDGNIGLSGGIIKGWSGSKGLVINLAFRAKTVGEAKISFTKKDIYLADGMGTKVLANISSKTIQISEKAKQVQIEELRGDKTPPDLSVSVIDNKNNGTSLIMFNSSDPESGIKNNEIRFKKWVSYGEWLPAQNPVLYPRDAWQAEVKTTNNQGVTNVKFVSTPIKLAYKIIILIFAVIFLVFVAKWVYNKMKSQTTKQYEA